METPSSSSACRVRTQIADIDASATAAPSLRGRSGLGLLDIHKVFHMLWVAERGA